MLDFEQPDGGEQVLKYTAPTFLGLLTDIESGSSRGMKIVSSDFDLHGNMDDR